MDGRDQIIQKILEEAHVAADAILANAKTNAEKQLAKAQNEADELLKAGKETAKQTYDNIVSKKSSVASIDSKKVTLSAKQAMIDEVYGRALAKLVSMDKQNYLKYISDRLDKFAGEGDKVVLSVNAPLSTQEVLDLPAVKKFNLTVTKTGEFKGGFVLETSVCDKNMSFEATVTEIRTITESEVAEKLFG